MTRDRLHITAIRTRAGIVQRLAADNAARKQSGQLIEQLLGVYDAASPQLGRAASPAKPDDSTPAQAIRSLLREMELESRVLSVTSTPEVTIVPPSHARTLFRAPSEG
ncbi:hypothetical protein KCP69_03310 [Salmonella enterica subsp. enterica]|nr:hypothetical protein KCP69_03310 [Salmonella enterica subsp. enterica]